MLSTLETLFSSVARVQVLHLLLRNPDRQYYQREIERETGQPIRAVQREVGRLADIGLLLRSEEGNRVFYSLNPEFPLLGELTSLFQVAAGDQAGDETATPERWLPPEPSTIPQPFSWIETGPAPPLPASLRRRQIEGEWDQAL
jgi:DNA-binding transcriptional ArsR family regulator